MIISYLGKRGGGALYTLHLLKEFSSNSCNLLGLFNRECEVYNDFVRVCQKCEAVHLPKHLLSAFNPIIINKFILQINKVLRYHSGEWLLITMASPFDIFLLIIVKIYRIRLAFVIHDISFRPGISRIGLWLTRLLAREADKIIVLSKSVRSECISLYPKWENKIVQSSHASFNYSKRNIPFIASLPLRLVFFGRICPYKGIEHVLAATTILQNEGHRVFLEVWGEGNFEVFSGLANKVKQLRVYNRWIKESEIPAIFSQPGIFMATYIQASQSGVIPLALGMGMPVLTSSVGALSEQILENYNGIIVRGSLNAENIAMKLRELLLDINKLQLLYDGAFHESRENGDWSTIAKDLLSELQ